MRRERFLSAAAAVAAAALVGAGVAAAATPRQIYNDWADNGRLDGVYSVRDLQSALSDATLQGYSPGGFSPAVREEIRNSGTLGEAERAGSLPFTGLDLALLAGGAFGLVLIGGGLRRLGKAKS